MWKSYIKSALRNFAKNKLTFFINLFGLALGLSVAILISLWVQDELSMDKIFEDNDRIYRIIGHQSYGDNIMTFANTPGILARELKNYYPEVEYAIAHTWSEEKLMTVKDKNLKYSGIYAESDFLKVVSHELLHGDAPMALANRENIVITEQIAMALFNRTDVVGESILIDSKTTYIVGGVLKNISSKSSHKFDFIINMERFFDENAWVHEWGNNGPYTLVKLKKGTDGDTFSEKIKGFIKERQEGSIVDLFAVPYAQNYLYGKYENGQLVGGRIEYVRMFSLIGLFVLIIACINFMNLATARSQKRAKEVGVRKVVGAGRNALIGQFISESMLLTFIAAIFSILFVELVMPSFNSLTGKELFIDYSQPSFFLMLFSIVLFTGLLAGSYPAFYLSAIKVVSIFKSNHKTSSQVNFTRKALVLFQFVTATILILGTLVIYKQIDFMLSKDLGYDKEQLISFRLQGDLKSERFEHFRNELLQKPEILHVSRAANYLTSKNSNTGEVNWEGRDPDASVLFEIIRVDHDFIPSLGLKVIKGRAFSREHATDTLLKVIINKTAYETIQNENGSISSLEIWGGDWEIIGVVDDFNFESLHSQVGPAIIMLQPQNTYAGFIKLSPDDVAGSLEYISSKAKEVNPNYPFDYTFMDDKLNKLYKQDERLRDLALYFAILTILISCLGLFALSAHIAEQKTKEIGIRKVLGASTMNILQIINREFVIIVSFSIAIGSIIGYWAINEFILGGFAFRISLEWWHILLAAFVIIMAAYITVSFQAFKATRINPVDTLKSE
ncbi:ABC transporter permease [Marivirga sp. S37H4]|uniref:ABC transporter permease n=1 Tax=Marivirga aurantiaca TaxID=2802615 RepID=A0A934WYS4_9BACT|nr:ABC transporter permease [Marivirga aurantiaca]MBK6265276.1 ABC transporter permease [Marivirga aurantiaca]